MPPHHQVTEDFGMSLNLASPKILTTPQQRNRYNMLKNVRTFWIKGVLENSLHGTVLMDLGMKQEVGQVDHPWDTLLKMPNMPDSLLPASTKILDIFDKLNGKLLILGAPGSGKTTTLLELTRDLLNRADQDDSAPMPVVFNLSAWSQNQRPLMDWLIDELGNKYQVSKDVAKEWVRSDTLLLLLDGLDEVAGARREECVQAINNYRQKHGFVDVVVCSRISDYELLTNKLKLNGAVMLKPLTEEQVDSYLTQLGASASAVRLLLQSDFNLQQMSQTPLMLSIMVLAYQGVSVKEVAQFKTLKLQRQHLFNNSPYAVDNLTKSPRWLRICNP